MSDGELNVVTGAFSYTGKYITRRLLDRGKEVRTLTGHPDRPNPFGDRVAAFPYKFERPGELTESLRGASTLYNTYWVRFSHGEVTFDQAVENTKVLVRAAEEVGVRRLVHVSITNPSLDSPLPYFRGKAELEEFIRQSSLSYAIIRPTVIYGAEDILVNNIAWLLRKFPFFVVPGSGSYRLQPIFVDDMADIAVDAAHQKGNLIIDAVGPDIFTYDELARLVADKIKIRARIIHLRPSAVLLLSRLMGYVVKDVVLTREEIEGLMGDLLISSRPPTGKTRLSDWLEENAATVGRRYSSELARHY